MKEITIEQAKNELIQRVSTTSIGDALYELAQDLIADKIVDIESEFSIVDSEGNPADSLSCQEECWYDEVRAKARVILYDKMKEFLEVV